MRFWVGVTDNNWFGFLSRADVDEVNFWQPSGRAPFAGLEVGAPFLFKLKRPYNHIAGGGTFVKFSTLGILRRLRGNDPAARSRSGCT